MSYRESVDRIQRAIDSFQAEQGILPILTAGEETPRYEKFRIDMDKLNKMGYIDEIPSTAFEKGGSAYFLLLNEEVDPTVKVMDLLTVQKVNDVQRQVNKYRLANDNKLPVQAQAEIYPGLFAVDLKLADAESFAAQSVFSGQEQAYLVDEQGQVYIDYAFDIMQAIDKSGTAPGDYDDLRAVLTEQSYFVPVKSLPYQWVDGSPVPKKLK
ncbi:hypothetical protein D3C81_1489940 [compost metagenome]